MSKWNIIPGDAMEGLRAMPADSVDCCITSPPYWGLRDYGHAGQIGLEESPEAYTAAMVEVFREVWRVLKPTGTLWLNLGDSYNAAGRTGHGTRQGCKQGTNRASANGSDHTRPSCDDLKPKDLVGIPWRVAFALQADGWYLRQDIIWAKPNPMPESVTDRCTKAHEYVFLLTKADRYFYDHEAVKEPAVGGQTGSAATFKRTGSKREQTIPGQGYGTHRPDREATEYNGETRNRRDVWTIPTKPFKGAHFAVMPEALVEPCIQAGCPEGGLVLDPFTGSGTVGAVAVRLGRRFVGCELNPGYITLAQERIREADPEDFGHMPLLATIPTMEIRA